jgi:DNA-binding NarL/FixJ family response regulator
MRENLKVLLTDDHAMVRTALKRVLQDVPGIALVGEADTANEALRQVREQHWDAVVLDLNMPGQNAMSVLKIMKVEQPELPVLVLSMYPEEQHAVRALKSGAAGYVGKASAADELVKAIQKVVQGDTYMSPNLAKTVTEHLRARPSQTVHELLSDREFTVLCAIAEGKSLSLIAEELNLSAKTVSTYRSRVLSKMTMRSNIALARYAVEHGLVT